MRWVIVWIVVALSIASVRGDDRSIEDRLNRLEQEVAALKQENEELRRDLGVAAISRQSDVKMNGRAHDLRIGGLIQVQGEAGDRGDSRFSTSNPRVFLRRARIDVAGDFVEGLSFRAKIELAGSLADASGLRAQLTDAFLSWNRLRSASVRIGQFKTPFGFEQLYAAPRLYSIERSLASDRLTAGRQVGIQLGGRGWDKRIDYSIGMFNGNGANSNFNDNGRFLTAARLSVVPLRGRVLGRPARWSVGIDGFRTRDANVIVAPELGIDSTPSTPARDNVFIGRRGAIGADTQIEIGQLEVWGEFLRDTFEPSNGVPSPRFRSRGAYGQAAYSLIPDKLQIVGRYETFDPSERASFDGTRTSTLGVNYYFKRHDVKLQFDFLRGRTPGLSKEQNKIIARLQTAF